MQWLSLIWLPDLPLQSPKAGVSPKGGKPNQKGKGFGKVSVFDPSQMRSSPYNFSRERCPTSPFTSPAPLLAPVSIFPSWAAGHTGG
jgi:hypothetical protein